MDDMDEAATPHYNTSILRDMVHAACLECMHKAIDDAPGIRDGVALLKVWLHQRALDMVGETNVLNLPLVKYFSDVSIMC